MPLRKVRWNSYSNIVVQKVTKIFRFSSQIICIELFRNNRLFALGGFQKRVSGLSEIGIFPCVVRYKKASSSDRSYIIFGSRNHILLCCLCTCRKRNIFLIKNEKKERKSCFVTFDFDS